MSSVSLEWNFNKDLSGFVKNQKVKVSREKIENEWYLICQAQQTKSTPGVKIVDLLIPNNGHEYCLEVDGFANNSKSFLWVLDSEKRRLIKDRVLLPEITTTQKLEPVSATFRLIEESKSGGEETEFSTITLGVLIGGKAPSTNDIFFVKRIRLLDSGIKSKERPEAAGDGISITRIYDTLDDLKTDLPNPNRCNETPMQPGEYALINCRGSSSGSSGSPSDHGKLFLAYSDPDLGHATNLRFICNITGPSNLLNESFRLSEDKIIPIYDGTQEALADVKDEALAPDFYSPTGKTNKASCLSVSDGQVYLYFDSKGYIRWVNANKARTTAQEATTLALDADAEVEADSVEVDSVDAGVDRDTGVDGAGEGEPEPELEPVPTEPLVQTEIDKEKTKGSDKIPTLLPTPLLTPRLTPLPAISPASVPAISPASVPALSPVIIKPKIKAVPTILPRVKKVPIISRK